MIAVPADPEHRVASGAEANPLTKNDLAMTSPFAPARRGWTMASGSWQVRTSFPMRGDLLRVCQAGLPGSLQRTGRSIPSRAPAEETLPSRSALMMNDG